MTEHDMTGSLKCFLQSSWKVILAISLFSMALLLLNSPATMMYFKPLIKSSSQQSATHYSVVNLTDEANKEMSTQHTDTLTSFQNSSNLTATEKEKPIQHVYFLKIHKTGSSSMHSIFAQYCQSHHLVALVPRPPRVHFNLGGHLQTQDMFLDPKIKFHDMVFNHQIYSPIMFNHLHGDVFRIAMLREPFGHVVSAFFYFRKFNHAYLKNIPGPDPFNEYILHHDKYEPSSVFASYTNNRQAIDLGYDVTHSFSDVAYINEFVSLVEKRFDLVLITEYFLESLVLMKRRLRWATQDLLYFWKLQNGDKYKNNQFTEQQRKAHANFSLADTSLYSHFLPVFQNAISKEQGLAEEVVELESILKQVRSFCDSNPGPEKLSLPGGRWSGGIDVGKDRCHLLSITEIAFTKHFQKLQQEMVRTL